jgi:hypothetical protein
MALQWCAAGMGEATKQFRQSTASSTDPPYEPPWNLTSTPMSHRVNDE